MVAIFAGINFSDLQMQFDVISMWFPYDFDVLHSRIGKVKIHVVAVGELPQADKTVS